jgi:hypothetical protein
MSMGCLPVLVKAEQHKRADWVGILESQDLSLGYARRV